MTITAKYASICPICSRSITPGQQVNWIKGSKATHTSCGPAPSTAPGHVSRPSRTRSAPNVPGYSKYCTDRPGCRCYDCE